MRAKRREKSEGAAAVTEVGRVKPRVAQPVNGSNAIEAGEVGFSSEESSF